jgi:hypothetical protein
MSIFPFSPEAEHNKGLYSKIDQNYGEILQFFESKKYTKYIIDKMPNIIMERDELVERLENVEFCNLFCFAH